jgi:hypothetical protein
MAREIKQLGITNPSADSETLIFSQGTAGLFIVSVTAANAGIEDARIDVWIQPSASASQRGYITNQLILPGRNAYETQKFTLNLNDSIFVNSTSASISFVTSGINQTEI